MPTGLPLTLLVDQLAKSLSDDFGLSDEAARWAVEVLRRTLSGRDEALPHLTVAQCHHGYVKAVAFSPDGRFALSGNSHGIVNLWEGASGQELRTFSGHTDGVWSVAFSPDGRYALSGSSDKTVKLWDVSSGLELRTFVGHAEWVGGVAFSPDGRYALSGGGDKTLKLWEVASGQELRSFVGHTSRSNRSPSRPTAALRCLAATTEPSSCGMWQAGWNSVPLQDMPMGSVRSSSPPTAALPCLEARTKPSSCGIRGVVASYALSPAHGAGSA